MWFDINIEDDKPNLKLPYNVTQNPYDAATKFLQDNELPMSYLEETANFIIKNTQGATIGQTPANRRRSLGHREQIPTWRGGDFVLPAQAFSTEATTSSHRVPLHCARQAHCRNGPDS